MLNKMKKDSIGVHINLKKSFVPINSLKTSTVKLAFDFGLQGFPVDKGYKLPTKINGKAYGDANLYKQAGNAVSVPIIKFISEFILKILEEEKNEAR